MAATKADYDKLHVEAAYAVMLELARLLREYHEGIVLVGGWVPYLLFDEVQSHIGSIDVDLALDQCVIQDTGYRTIKQLLISRGYIESTQPYMFIRSIVIEGHEIKVEVDFLAAEYGGTGSKHRTQRVQDMRPRKVRACDLAFHDSIEIAIEGTLPDGGKDKAQIRVVSLVPFLMMKAQALADRLKEKDAYDIYHCLTSYPEALGQLAEAFQPHRGNPLVEEGLSILAEKFQSPEHVGPTHVANFLEETDPEERSMIRRDAFERIHYLLKCLGYKPA